MTHYTTKSISIAIGILLLISSNPLYAANDTRDKLFEELERIKNEQSSHSENITDFQEQGNAVMLQVGQTQDSARASAAEVATLEERMRQVEETLTTRKNARNGLLRKLYIDSNAPNKMLLALFEANSLSDLLREQIYLRKAQKNILGNLKTLLEETKTLEEERLAAEILRGRLLAQIDQYNNQLVGINQSIALAEQSILDLEKNRADVEKQILALDVPKEPKNTTSNTAYLDSVDFTTQNTLTFYGGGTEHGLGMSQYGAKAMADQGKSYSDILTHYYQGTYVQDADTSGHDVRVRLSASPYGGTITVAAGSATVSGNGVAQLLTTGESIAAQAGLVITPSDDVTRLSVDYKYDRFKIYRGSIEIHQGTSGIITVNRLNIEDYLRSVISGEMSARWALEALKAQAVAARNYAYKNYNPGVAYDLCDTPACQVYLGASYEFDKTDQAVAETAGKLLYYGNEIITAYYFSTSGGWTENNENVWGGTPLPWLRGVPSPGEEESPYHRWQTGNYTKAEMQAWLNSDSDTYVGELQRIDITKRGVSGRVMAVQITGSDGIKTVTGRTFKYVINVNLADGTQDYVKSILFGIQ